MSLKKFLVSRTFFTHLIIAIAIVTGLLFITMQSIKKYTRHGQSNPVPDFTGLTQDEAAVEAQKHMLKIIVIDSVFTDKVDPGEVIEQVPNPGFGVKENRTVFLTINSTNKEKVVLPKLTDISFRQAQVLVENCGLQVGEIKYKPSEYNNLVLDVSQDSTMINEGDLLLKGSKIDFVVGRDSENEETTLPDLTGLKIEEAKELLTKAMLNFGVLIYDESFETAEDTLNAVIWQQRPDARAISSVDLGTSVDFWITVNEEKINNLKEQKQESELDFF